MMQTEFIQECFQLFTLIFLRQSGHLQDGFDIIFDRQFSENGCLLWQITKAKLSPFIHGQPGDIAVVEKNLTLVWLDQSDDHVKCCCFSRSVWAQKTYDFALFNINRNMVDHGSVMIAFYEIICMDSEAQDSSI